MGGKVVIPCMVPFSGDQLRTPTGRHRWRSEVYATMTVPGNVFATIEATIMDDKCVFCGNWRGDILRALPTTKSRSS